MGSPRVATMLLLMVSEKPKQKSVAHRPFGDEGALSVARRSQARSPPNRGLPGSSALASGY
jgi:hypothetical protein